MEITSAELGKKMAFFRILHGAPAKQPASLTQLLHEQACTFSMHVPEMIIGFTNPGKTLLYET